MELCLDGVSSVQDAQITDSTNEAKDNVRYLYTLDKYFGPLVKCTPRDLIGEAGFLFFTVLLFSV